MLFFNKKIFKILNLLLLVFFFKKKTLKILKAAKLKTSGNKNDLALRLKDYQKNSK